MPLFQGADIASRSRFSAARCPGVIADGLVAMADTANLFTAATPATSILPGCVTRHDDTSEA